MQFEFDYEKTVRSHKGERPAPPEPKSNELYVVLAAAAAVLIAVLLALGEFRQMTPTEENVMDFQTEIERRYKVTKPCKCEEKPPDVYPLAGCNCQKCQEARSAQFWDGVSEWVGNALAFVGGLVVLAVVGGLILAALSSGGSR